MQRAIEVLRTRILVEKQSTPAAGSDGLKSDALIAELEAAIRQLKKDTGTPKED